MFTPWQVAFELASAPTVQLPAIEPGSLTWLPKLTKLRELDLISISLNREDLEALNGLPSLESLLIWNIRWAPNAPTTIETLSGLKSSRSIRTNETLAHKALLDLSDIPTIEFIGDELTAISDDELRHLAKLPKLHSLILDSPHITSNSIDTLKLMKSLRLLSVSEKVKLTPEQLTSRGRDSLLH